MRGLKALVAVMTTLILAAMGLLVYGFVTKLGPSPVQGMADLILPQKSIVKQITAYKDNLAIYVSTPDGEYIYFYNPQKGAPDGRLALKKEQ
jgi:hypothetical protein